MSRMQSGHALLIAGVWLLATSALVGFIQHRYRRWPEAFSSWRVVHVGGTAGAVQLLALSFVWTRLTRHETLAAVLASGLIFATLAFFIGPLATALGRARLAKVINRAGAVVAAPCYLTLPLILLWGA